MRSDLCRALALCQARRVATVSAAAPLAALVVAVAALLVPFFAFRLGGTLGSELGVAGLSFDLAVAILVGPALGAAAAGVVIGGSLPGREGLGSPLVASPVGAVLAILAGSVVPCLLAGILVLPSLAAVCLGLGDGLPGGRAAGLGLLVGIVAAGVAGAAAGEAVRALWCGRHAVGLGLAAALGVWAAAGAMLGAVALGPLEPIAAALDGSGSPWQATVLGGLTALACLGAWLAVASRRPVSRGRTSGRTRTRTWRPGLAPVPDAVAAIVLRRGDVRLAAAAAVVFGVGGAAIGSSGGGELAGSFLLATSTALLCSIVGALASFGALATGRWLWCGAPLSRRSLSLLTASVGLAAVAAPVALVGCVAASVSHVAPQVCAVIVALTVGAAATATIAGTLAPWSRESAGAQIGSLTALVGVGFLVALVVGAVGPRLEAAGVPGPVVAAGLCVSLFVAAVASLNVRLAGGAA